MSPLTADRPGSRSILLIDDDTELCALVTEYLEREHYRIESVHSGEEGLDRALSEDHSLVVLDVMLPGMNGFEVLRAIRAESDKPVVMLSARGEEIDRIVGFEVGADDYLAKPFNPRELLVRIQAILRRLDPPRRRESGSSPVETLVSGDVELDLGTRSVYLNQTPVRLTAIEFDLLEVLIRSAGKVVSRTKLSKSVLSRDLSPLDRSLDMHISKVRRKLGAEVSGVERIKTVRGVGYMYARLDRHQDRDQPGPPETPAV